MRVFRNFFLAIRFLTIIPLPQWSEDTDEDMAQAMYWFPVVGMGIGALAGACAWIASFWQQETVIAVVAVIASTLVTGAMHIDGLADTCDGLWGGRDRESRLRIMKDHAIGAYGAAAMILVLMLKVACILDLLCPGNHGHEFSFFLVTLVPATMAARWATVLGAALSPYARTEGTGRSFVEVISFKHAVLATLLLVAAWSALVATCFHNFAWQDTLAVLATRILAPALATVVVLTAWCRHRIGGVTGDTLGAMSEITEVVVLMSLVVIP